MPPFRFSSHVNERRVFGGSAAVEHNAFHDAHINLNLRTSMQMQHARCLHASSWIMHPTATRKTSRGNLCVSLYVPILFEHTLELYGPHQGHRVTTPPVAAAAFSLSAARLRCSRRRNDAERFSPPDVAPSAGAASISGGGSGGGGTTAAAPPLVLSALRAEDGPNEALRGRWLREGVPTCFQAAISLFGCRDC
jgi:hypothetical protein